ncbi:MAG: Fic/DOC family protein [Planctomycetaceae bacterium]
MSDGNISDRYRVPEGHPEAAFVDAEQTILVNKPGYTELESLQVAEEVALARAYEQLLVEVRMDTLMTCELLLHIHRSIFGELFEWAGRWRTVQISKPGAIWPPPQFLEQAMLDFERAVLRRHPARSLASDDLFCKAAAEIQGEFLSIHPFREGNARTIKLLTDLLAAQSGRPILLYDSSDAGRDRYIEAAKAGLLTKSYQPLVEIIRESLERGQTR